MNLQARPEWSGRSPGRHESRPSNQMSDASADLSHDTGERIQQIVQNSGFQVLKSGAAASKCVVHPTEPAIFGRSESSRLVCFKCVFLSEMLHFKPHKHLFSEEEGTKILLLNGLYSAFVELGGFYEASLPKKPLFSEGTLARVQATVAAQLARLERDWLDTRECQALQEVAEEARRELAEFKTDVANNYAKILFKMEMKPFEQIIESYHSKLRELRHELEAGLLQLPGHLRLARIGDEVPACLVADLRRCFQKAFGETSARRFKAARNYAFTQRRDSSRGNRKWRVETVMGWQRPSTAGNTNPDSGRRDGGLRNPAGVLLGSSLGNLGSLGNLASVLKKSQRFSEFFKGSKGDRRVQGISRVPGSSQTSLSGLLLQVPALPASREPLWGGEAPPQRAASQPELPASETASKSIFNQEYNESSVHSRPSIETGSLPNRSSHRDAQTFSPSSNITFQRNGDLARNNSTVSVPETPDLAQPKLQSTFETRPGARLTPDFTTLKHPHLYFPEPRTGPGQLSGLLPGLLPGLVPGLVPSLVPGTLSLGSSPLLPEPTPVLVPIPSPAPAQPTNFSPKTSEIRTMSLCDSNAAKKTLSSHKKMAFDELLCAQSLQQTATRGVAASLRQSIETGSQLCLGPETGDVHQLLRKVNKETDEALQKISIHLPPSGRKTHDRPPDVHKRSTSKIKTALTEDHHLTREAGRVIDLVHNFLVKRPALPALPAKGSSASNWQTATQPRETRGRPPPPSLPTDAPMARLPSMEAPKIEPTDLRRSVVSSKEGLLKSLLKAKLKAGPNQLRKLKFGAPQAPSTKGDNGGLDHRSPKHQKTARMTREEGRELLERLLTRH